LYCLYSVFCFIKMKIGLLTIGAALLSAQYVAGAYPKVSAHTSSGAILLQTAGRPELKAAKRKLGRYKKIQARVQKRLAVAQRKTEAARQELEDLQQESEDAQQEVSEKKTCTYEKFQKVVTIQTDDKSIEKKDLKFKTQKWLKEHVVDEDEGKFTVTMNCDCCDPKGKLCTFKCEDGGIIDVSATGNSGQRASLWLSNYGSPVSKFGELTFSSERGKIDNHDRVTVSIEYKKYGSRRRLLQGGKNPGC
jgi:Skp family chaperone for outer membrane proteins